MNEALALPSRDSTLDKKMDKCTADHPTGCPSKPQTVGHWGEKSQSGAGIREGFLEEVEFEINP